jgi:hypothetical protein
MRHYVCLYSDATQRPSTHSIATIYELLDVLFCKPFLLHQSKVPNYIFTELLVSIWLVHILVGERYCVIIELLRMASCGMLRSVALVRTDVSKEPSASLIRVTRIGELGTTLAVTSN